MPSVSKVDICNLTLMKLGAQRITSLTEVNDHVTLFNEFYDRVRQATLEAYPWRFALRRASLVKSAAAPEWDFTNQFALPSGCLKVETTDAPDSEWIEESGFILSNRDSMKITFIFDETDTTKFSPLYVEALAEHLASEMSIGVQGLSGGKQTFFELYQGKLREARTRDSQVGSPKKLPEADLNIFRHS